MRRPLLLLLAPLVLALPVPPAAAQSPSPAARETVAVTLADDGRTVRVRPGSSLQVSLGPTAGAVWEGLEQGSSTLHTTSLRSTEQDGLRATLDALSPGRYGGSAEVRPQVLQAVLRSRCEVADPACPAAGRSWSLQVVVDDGPVDESEPDCRSIADRAYPSPAPGTVRISEADDGRTVTVPRDGRLEVTLDTPCGGTEWTPPRAGAPLFRESAGLEHRFGFVDALFTPQGLGTTTVTSTLDARCLHRTDAGGNGTCAVGQRAFSVTVQVGSAPPTCTAGDVDSFAVSPLRLAAGDPAAASGGRSNACTPESQQPERQFSLRATPEGGTESETYAVRARTFRYAELRPRVTTTYRLLMDGRQLGSPQTVVVDRTSGTCADEVTAEGRPRAVAGQTAVLSGRAPAGAAVRVFFRRYGATSFALRRTLTAGADGLWSTPWTVADDHRWYAATDRCDSAVGLTRAAPRIVGPAVVRRGQTVVLRVEAVPGVRTTVFFRGTGEPFSARRTLTGPGTVTYTATRDQRYYALTRDTVSAPGLTQVR